MLGPHTCNICIYTNCEQFDNVGLRRECLLPEDDDDEEEPKVDEFELLCPLLPPPPLPTYAPEPLPPDSSLYSQMLLFTPASTSW